MNNYDPHNLLGIVLPTNNPGIMWKYLIPSLKNAKAMAPFVTFLINFQNYEEDEIEAVVEEFENQGFKVEYDLNNYSVKGPGLVPVNKIREDTARINSECKYYMIFDDDMSFMGPSSSINRNAGEQILEALYYLLTYEDCGVLVFGGTLIKKIAKDTIAPIDYCREYVTGKGLIFKNLGNPGKGLFVPVTAYELLGSDEEKVAAAYRISNGLWTAEMPFVRINHYENQKSSRNKNGKTPGKELYRWNTDEIKDSNNFGFIREFYCPEYKSGNGYVVSRDLYHSAGGKDVWSNPAERTIDFSSYSQEDLVEMVKEKMES